MASPPRGPMASPPRGPAGGVVVSHGPAGSFPFSQVPGSIVVSHGVRLFVFVCVRARAAASIAAAAAERRDLRCSSFYHRAYIVIMNYESAGVDRSSLSLFPFSIHTPALPLRLTGTVWTLHAGHDTC